MTTRYVIADVDIRKGDMVFGSQVDRTGMVHVTNAGSFQRRVDHKEGEACPLQEDWKDSLRRWRRSGSWVGVGSVSDPEWLFQDEAQGSS